VFTTQPTDPGHVIPIGADAFTPLAARGAGFVSGKFVRCSASVGGTATFSGDFTLALSVHRGKSTITCSGLHLTAPLSVKVAIFAEAGHSGALVCHGRKNKRSLPFKRVSLKMIATVRPEGVKMRI
jgi:hypothetical protein